MSNNNTFSPIEHATPISNLKKRLEKRKTSDEQNPVNHNDSETSSSFSTGQKEIEIDTQSIKKQLKLHMSITQSRRKHQNGYAINVTVIDLKSTQVKHQRVY